jgi:hypothetical protein
MHIGPEPLEFLRVMAPAVRVAAEIARDFEGSVANRPKSGEASDVKAALTFADTEAQEALLAPLLRHFPDVGLRAEEDTPTVARFTDNPDSSVVIDPIDGTLRFYLEGAGPYAVMVGLASRRQYEAAIVALPREGYQLEAVRGGGARFDDGRGEVRPARFDHDSRKVLVSHDLGVEAVSALRSRGFDIAPACGGAISVAPLLPGVCAGLRIATNEPPNVSIRGRVGAMIAAEAGALVRSETGAPFPGDIETPARALLVAPSEDVLGALRAALAASGTT